MSPHVLLALSLTALGCASPSAKQCSSNLDCRLGSYCLTGVCRVDCRGDFDCPGGRCESGLGQCVVADGGAGDGPRADLAGADLAAVAPTDLAAGADLASLPDLLGALPYGAPCSVAGMCKPVLAAMNLPL
ncbi:MAG: hypothetical protein EXR72_20625 [Myxococcales bacterium]|nr:hypothetical protein [Myxococcales bacterium]